MKNFDIDGLGLKQRGPHPEEHATGVRLEGWAQARCLLLTLRDATLRVAPQGEVLLATIHD
jgi:hypothetical protein